MPIDYSSLTVVPASAAQAAQARANIFATWVAPLGIQSLEQLEWMVSELHAPGNPWAREWGVWVLVPRSDPTTTDILAHCETYRRRGTILRPDVQELEQVTSYAVCLVFTPTEHRKKGYATHLMRLLHYILAPTDSLPPFPAEWGSPPLPEPGYRDARFSFLFSDVGDMFYAKCSRGRDVPGWTPTRNRHPVRVWTLGLHDEDRDDVPAGWAWLDDASVVPLEESASASMRLEASDWNQSRNGGNSSSSSNRHAGAKSDTRNAQPITVFVPPQDGLLRFSPRRERLLTLAADIVIPHHRQTLGLKLGFGDSSPWFTFTVQEYEGVPPVLVIDLMHKPDEIPFEAVRKTAGKVGATVVKCWGGYDGWDAAVPGQPALDFNEHVPCIAVYGDPEVEAEVEWLWCQQ